MGTSGNGIDHVLVTRFNLPSAGAESVIRAQDGWLRHRCELFERYCLPSVRAQTCRDFSWLIYFDPESPEWLRARIDELAARGDFVPVWRATVSTAELLHDIQQITGGAGRELLTTNLDNDDGLAADFVERLQQAAVSAPRTALYLTSGVIRSGSTLHHRVDRDNAFCSVRESWQAPVTCWADWHNRLARTMPVVEIPGPPGWLQVVHGANVSNRIRGRRTRPSEVAHLFPGLLDDMADPRRQDIARDRLLTVPVRGLREAARTATKRIILATVGTSGLNRVKDLRANRAGHFAKDRNRNAPTR